MADTIQQFDFSVDLLRAILWQYDSAVNLQKILEDKGVWYDENQRLFWENWIRDVFDIRTANQFGLTVWGIILGMQLYVNIPPSNTNPVWGFGGTNDAVNFGFGNFQPNNGSSYQLPVNIQRMALLLRYGQITSSGTVPETNRLLKSVFGDQGVSYLLDLGGMRQRYVFNFALSADLKYLFDNYDILPRPAGVQSEYIEDILPYFGFDPYGLNFNNGNFGA